MAFNNLPPSRVPLPHPARPIPLLHPLWWTAISSNHTCHHRHYWFILTIIINFTVIIAPSISSTQSNLWWAWGGWRSKSSNAFSKWSSSTSGDTNEGELRRNSGIADGVLVKEEGFLVTLKEAEAIEQCKDLSDTECVIFLRIILINNLCSKLLCQHRYTLILNLEVKTAHIWNVIFCESKQPDLMAEWRWPAVPFFLAVQDSSISDIVFLSEPTNN